MPPTVARCATRQNVQKTCFQNRIPKFQHRIFKIEFQNSSRSTNSESNPMFSKSNSKVCSHMVQQSERERGSVALPSQQCRRSYFDDEPFRDDGEQVPNNTRTWCSNPRAAIRTREGQRGASQCLLRIHRDDRSEHQVPPYDHACMVQQSERERSSVESNARVLTLCVVWGCAPSTLLKAHEAGIARAIDTHHGTIYIYVHAYI